MKRLFVYLIFVMLCISIHAERKIVLGKAKKIQIISQKDFSTEKTRYIILYDCQLDEDVIIPKNSSVEFQGGIIKGQHSIKGQHTTLHGGRLLLFGKDVRIKGSWIVNDAYPEWFGAKSDGITDDTEAIQKTLMFHNIRLSSGTYLVKGIVIGNYPDINIRGDNTIIKTKNTSLNTRFNVFGNLDMSSRNTSYDNGRFI